MKEKNRGFQLLLQLLIIVALIGFVYVFYKRQINISSFVEDLKVSSLPYYIMRSLIRMFAAYGLSLVFAFAYGYLAATNKRRETIMIPVLDILQSVPILGFFPVAVSFFISLFPGSIFGVELAAIFLIFTSQSWNIAFGVYESIKAIPQDLMEAYDFFDPNGILKLRRLYIPSSIPKVIYNSMVSWSNGCIFGCFRDFCRRCQGVSFTWYRKFYSCIGDRNKIGLVLLGIVVLAFTILLLDMFMWRPLSQWSSRFKYSVSSGEEEEREVLDIVVAFWELVGNALRYLKKPFQSIDLSFISNIGHFFNSKIFVKIGKALRYVLIILLIGVSAFLLFSAARFGVNAFTTFKLSYLTTTLQALLFSFLRIVFRFNFVCGKTIRHF